MKDNNVYIKKDNGRYEAIGLQYDRDWLGDGIWSVKHSEGSTSIRNLNHYNGIVKVGDAKYPDYSKLAGVLEIADKIATSEETHNLINGSYSILDIVNSILSQAACITDEVELKSKKLPYKIINDTNLTHDGFVNRGAYYEKVISTSWYKVHITTGVFNNPRYSLVEVFTKYDNKKVAEFRAEFIHQIYQFIKLL